MAKVNAGDDDDDDDNDYSNSRIGLRSVSSWSGDWSGMIITENKNDLENVAKFNAMFMIICFCSFFQLTLSKRFY